MKHKIEYIKQGYSYVKCTSEDCYRWGGMSICDSCSEKMYFDVYLIFVLASAYCPECFKEWKERATRYESDLILQKNNHKFWYKAQLPDLEDEES